MVFIIGMTVRLVILKVGWENFTTPDVAQPDVCDSSLNDPIIMTHCVHNCFTSITVHNGQESYDGRWSLGLFRCTCLW